MLRIDACLLLLWAAGSACLQDLAARPCLASSQRQLASMALVLQLGRSWLGWLGVYAACGGEKAGRWLAEAGVAACRAACDTPRTLLVLGTDPIQGLANNVSRYHLHLACHHWCTHRHAPYCSCCEGGNILAFAGRDSSAAGYRGHSCR
jgi:hypothetical protein